MKKTPKSVPSLVWNFWREFQHNIRRQRMEEDSAQDSKKQLCDQAQYSILFSIKLNTLAPMPVLLPALHLLGSVFFAPPPM